MKKLSYTQFLWKSKNAHGIHSPFVYGVVSQCFYNKVGKLYTKQRHVPVEGITPDVANILYKIMFHFKPSTFYILGDEATKVTEMLRTLGEKLNTNPWFLSTLAPITSPIDLAYLSGSNTSELLPLLEEVLPNANNKTVCVIGNIHKTDATETAWDAIKKHPNVTVTIDTYHLGLVFFRSGQAKQHFTIRPYKNRLIDALLGIRNLWGLLG